MQRIRLHGFLSQGVQQMRAQVITFRPISIAGGQRIPYPGGRRNLPPYPKAPGQANT